MNLVNDLSIFTCLHGNYYRRTLLRLTVPGTLQPFTELSQVLSTQRENTLENILEKGENAGNQHFLLFPKCFLLISRPIQKYY